MGLKKSVFVFGFILAALLCHSQSLENIGITKDQGARVVQFILDDSTVVRLTSGRPLFSFRLNGALCESDDVETGLRGSTFAMIYPGGLDVSFTSRGGSHPGWMSELTFRNNGRDTITLSDVVPFGQDNGNVYITGYGPWDLARARLFVPGRTPVRIILPDNAWEMGFSAFGTDTTLSVCAIARRTGFTGARRARYETIMPPGSSVTYHIYGDIYTGPWQEGLRLMFNRRYLYDLSYFDNSLYRRDDLKWIRKSYLMILQMAWDRQFYDRFRSAYTFSDFISEYDALFGHVDIFALWPSWPRLGLDERNQWDLYRTLPGGLNAVRDISRQTKQNDCRFFISYNPWDRTTRPENHLKGMKEIIELTEADGVVLDTLGNGWVFQQAADSVRSGVVMYPEAMAVVKDMPSILSGRVHNAIFLSPELNLNKLIKPDLAIFRVADVGEDILHREISVAFFNGYGTELNLYRPGGRGDEYTQDLEYLSRTTFLLRQNSDAFLDSTWTPLLNTSADRVYVNRWNSDNKTLYTVLSMDHRGIDSPMFEVSPEGGRHIVSLWHHKELDPVITDGRPMVPVRTEPWDSIHTGTRRESSVDCIALFPPLLKAELRGNSLHVASDTAGTINIYRGNPGYGIKPYSLTSPADSTLEIDRMFGYMEGKIVVQLIRDDILLDERVVIIRGGKPWLVSTVNKTSVTPGIPEGMVLVPAATIRYKFSSSDDFILYPSDGEEITARPDSFLIDKYPVTNEQYLKFIRESLYIPDDTANYLKHWENGLPVTGQEKYPVVHVSLEDARAYAAWAGKRLPAEAEWQLAAQGTDGRKWPWGNDFQATKCNSSFGRPTPVDAFPKGESPYGVADLVGNVWQMTNDVYCNGPYYFNIIRGGSFFKPTLSWWYIKGGPQQLDMTQILLLVSPGYDRSSTVGFRCVKDVE